MKAYFLLMIHSMITIFLQITLLICRFLVCNLAAADFFMGLYLGFLAVVDASTLGEFRRYAISWQFSTGCQVKTFTGVSNVFLNT